MNKSSFQPRAKSAGEQLVEILEYFEEANLRLQVKTKDSLSIWFDIPNMEYSYHPDIEQIKDNIQISSEDTSQPLLYIKPM